MKYLIIVYFLICSIGLTQAQDRKFGTNDYAAPFYVIHPVEFDSDSSVAMRRTFEPHIPEPLFLVKQDGVIKEITKSEFEELARNTKGNIEYVKSLDSSMFGELYGSRGRNGAVLVGLKSGQPTFSEEFLDPNHSLDK